MKLWKTNLIILLIICYFPNNSVYAQTALEIMLKVDKVSNESFSSSIQKMKLSTCKYGIQGKKMRCLENPRIKMLETVQKKTGEKGEDSYSIAIILEPVGERGIGMLTWDYDDAEKDADTWLYFSALGKVRRIISSTEDDDESGSFFGTEFSIEDMESTNVDEYTYKILKETTYQNRPVWIIESIPKLKQARKTRYGKTIVWIDKERHITLKANLYNRHGKPYKQLTMQKIELIDNVWLAGRVTMNNLVTRRVTHMNSLSVAFNIDVPGEFLTQRTLTDHAFRERNMVQLRTHIK